MNKNIRYTLGKNNRCHEVNLKMVKKKGGRQWEMKYCQRNRQAKLTVNFIPHLH